MKQILLLLLIFIATNVNAQRSDFKTIDFSRADKVAKLNEGMSLDNLSLLAHKLTYSLPTKVEKFRAIYTWVCTNIKNDPKQERIISRKRRGFKNDSISFLKWNHEYKKIAFKKLLKHKKTMCTGYAYLIKELCFLANIECKIIDGYGRSVFTNIDKLELANHSWNAVKLNEKWYLCDPTWSSGYVDGRNIFRKEYNEGYFLTDPVMFAKSHHPLQEKWLLDSTLINTSFVETPLIYREAYKHQVIPMSPDKMNVVVKKNTEVKFSFKSLHDTIIDQVSIIRIIGNEEKKYKIYDLKTEGALTTFKNKFKYKGRFDVHLKTNNEIVATYVMKVE
ncbi:transglutaminase domain-containing protein [Ascidiimonas sp. W6]|uniref:transglutaminase domain-containing protein n=1 Tax=Ascidiimonas meishanensis TaxID=3128903 RepID=UPI0030EC6E0B